MTERSSPTGEPGEELTPRLLQDLAAMLVQERDRLQRSLRALVAAQRALGESQGEESDAGGEAADVASDLAEQALEGGLVQAELDRLREVEDALHRMDEGRYGICEACGKPIAVARLYAHPSARYCIDCARRVHTHPLPSR